MPPVSHTASFTVVSASVVAAAVSTISAAVDVDNGVPMVDTGRSVLMGALWNAQDQPYDSAAGSGLDNVLCGDSMGWAPGSLPKFAQAGDYTCCLVSTSGGRAVRIFRSSTVEAASVIASLVAFDCTHCHGELFPNSVVDSVNPNVPGFTFCGLNAGAFETRHISIAALTTVRSATVWSNELSRAMDEIRLVSARGASLTPIGTVIATFGPSTVNPGGLAFYLKNTADPAGAAGPAQEIRIDIRPSESFDVDLTRWHVVDLGNGQLNFYYSVVDTESDTYGTAMFSYSPGLSASESLEFNARGVIIPPTLIVSGLVPVVSMKGARRHPVTNEILLALEYPETDPDTEVYWFLSRGLGLKIDPIPLVWDAEKHPNLYGGLIKATCPSRTVSVLSVGWTGNRAGHGFPIVAGLALGDDVPAYQTAFQNSFNPGLLDWGSGMRVCLGEIVSTRSEGEYGAHGVYAVLDQRSGPWTNAEASRIRYDATADLLAAVAIFRLNEVDPELFNNEVAAFDATSTDVVPGPGHGVQAQIFQEDGSQISVPNDGVLDGDSFVVSAWVLLQESAAPATRTIFYKEGAGATTAFMLEYVEGTNTLNFRINTTVSGTTVVSAVVTPGGWYHIALAYDEPNGAASLYIDGILVSRASAISGVLNHLANSPFIVGSSSGLNISQNSWRGRVYDLVLSVTPPQHISVLQDHMHGLSTADGPGRVGFETDFAYNDCVVATASVSVYTGPLYGVVTVALRNVTTSIYTGFRRGAVLDVWLRDFDEETPTYLGTCSLPTEVHDSVSGGVEPRLVGGASPFLRVFADGEDLDIFVGVQYESLNTEYAVWRIPWDVSTAPNPWEITAADRVLTLDLTNDDVDAVDVIPWAAEPTYLVLFASHDTGAYTRNRIYFIREANWGVGALAASAYADLTDLMPPASAAGSYYGYDYEPDFGNTGEPIVRGLVSRELLPNMGWHSDFHGFVQFIFGVAATSTAGTSIVDDLVVASTVCGAVSDAQILIDTRPLVLPFQPRQWDEYAYGGHGPVQPVRWLQNPETPIGDSLLLGITHTRTYRTSERRGNGGLDVYRMRREGTWGASPVVPVGPTYGVPDALLSGADITLWRDASSNPQYRLVCSRPLPDARDAVSTTVLTEVEAAAVGWDIPSPSVNANPLVRRSDNLSTVTWTDYAVSLRNFTEEVAGAKLEKSSLHHTLPVLRWNVPGFPLDMSNRYAQDFDNELWVEPHQGADVSVTARVIRLWQGLDTLYPSIGGKQFRVATQLASAASGVGTVLRDPTTIPGGQERVAPVGILDIPEEEAGHYYYLVYNDAGSPVRLDYYRSPWAGELPAPAGSTFTAWTLPYSLPQFSERGMRVVDLGDRQMLYFLLTSGTKTRVLSVELVHGQTNTASGTLVADLDFRVDDRFYAVVTEHDDTPRVALYFGNSDYVYARRTTVLVHEPLSGNGVVRPLKVVSEGATPFPRSYAACLGRDDLGIPTVVVALETDNSRNQGGAVDVLASPVGQLPGSFAEGGSSWQFALTSQDGYYLCGTLGSDAETLRAWMGGTFAGSYGGAFKTRAQPHMLKRVGGEHSTEYALIADVRVLMQPADTFVFRFDDTSPDPANSDRRAEYGENSSTATLFADAMLPSPSGGSRNDVGLLVPGSLQLEPIGGIETAAGPLAVIAGVANRLASWAVTDDNNHHGQNNLGPLAAQVGTANMNPATDHVDGVKADVFSADQLFIVGWWHSPEGT